MYQPNKNGANLILHHVGQWRDSSGTQRWLNAKITVNGQNLGSLVYYESQHKFLASYGKWDRHTSSRPYMDVTVDFLLDDGSTPQGLRGVTGFTDLDGGTSGYNEGVELVSGFDGAYVRSDAHLARFGTNGWAGTTDENKNNADAHGMKHYVGATFTAGRSPRDRPAGPASNRSIRPSPTVSPTTRTRRMPPVPSRPTRPLTPLSPRNRRPTARCPTSCSAPPRMRTAV